MGSGRSVQLSTGVDSVAEPGKPCVQSAALETDYIPLLEETLEQMRYPVDSYKEYVLKSCEVEEHGPDDFTVKVILDGEKLDKYGYGDGKGTDRIDLWTRVKADRAGRTVVSSPIVPPPGCWVTEVDTIEQGGFGQTTFLDEPLRVEFFISLPDGTRLADDIAKGALQPTLDAAMQNLSQRKVKVMAEQDSLAGDGMKSAISEGMDEHTDFETFWDKFLAVMKAPPGPIQPEVTEVSDTEFHTKTLIPTDPAKPEETQEWTSVVRHMKDSGEVQSESFCDGKLMSCTTTIVHRDPLRVETWGKDVDGVRQAGRGVARGLQGYLETVLASESKGWFW